MPELSNITATEVAEWVFCRHSWLLRREGARQSDQAMNRLEAGVGFQTQKDAVVITAVERQAQAKSAARLATYAALVFLLLVGLWVFSLISQR